MIPVLGAHDLRAAPIVDDAELWARRWWLARRLALSALGVVVLLWAVGWPLIYADALSWVRDVDASVSADIAAARSPIGEEISAYGSSLADTLACIGVLIIVATTLRLWLRRWFEAVILAAAIAGELVIFLAVTGVIPRERPAVELLDPAPPTSSYPSGHTAAAVALYGCIAVLIVRLLRPLWLAVPLVTLLWLVPMAVGSARIYRGMHHLSDVVVGMVGGGIWLLLVLMIFGALAAGSLEPGARRSTPDAAVAARDA